jgi:hypothetical protein
MSLRSDYQLRVSTPVTPLPKEEAERILKRMYRHVDWDTLFKNNPDLECVAK